MQKFSELIGKKVLSLYESREEGAIVGCLLSPKLDKIAYFEVANEEGSLFFAPSSLFALSECAVIKNSSMLFTRASLTKESAPCPVNFPAFSPLGKSLGVVTDLYIENAEVTSIELGERQFPPSSLVRRGEEILFFSEDGKKVKLTPPVSAPKAPIPAPSPSAPVVNAMPVVESESPEREVFVPVRLSKPDGESKSGFDFLLGKTVNADILSGDGSPIALSGQTIDENILSAVSKEGKLVLLALYSN